MERQVLLPVSWKTRLQHHPNAWRPCSSSCWIVSHPLALWAFSQKIRGRLRGPEVQPDLLCAAVPGQDPAADENCISLGNRSWGGKGPLPSPPSVREHQPFAGWWQAAQARPRPLGTCLLERGLGFFSQAHLLLGSWPEWCNWQQWEWVGGRGGSGLNQVLAQEEEGGSTQSTLLRCARGSPFVCILMLCLWSLAESGTFSPWDGGVSGWCQLSLLPCWSSLCADLSFRKMLKETENFVGKTLLQGAWLALPERLYRDQTQVGEGDLVCLFLQRE